MRARKFIKFIIYCFIAIIFTLINSCSPTTHLDKMNLSSALAFNDNSFTNSAIVYHETKDSSLVFFDIEQKNLLYKKESEEFTALLKVHYDFFPSYNTTTILDSATKFIQYTGSANEQDTVDHFYFKCLMGSIGLLKITYTDLNRSKSISMIVNVDKTDTLSRQFWLLQQQFPSVKNYIHRDAHFTLNYAWPHQDVMYVHCYFKNYPLASPPFKLTNDFFDYTCDSSFTIKMEDVAKLDLKRKGFYHFLLDTNSRNGYTLFVFDNDFPLITVPNQLIPPTRYLTTGSEFKELVYADDKKIAADKFWLNLGMNEETARQLIRVYFQRVQNANRLFTSYLEGWKTDKGMIYIIYGKPQTIYNDGKMEVWTYVGTAQIPDVSFEFKKMNNPFSDNDYSLIRQAIYENSWYLAVDHWRQGRILNDYE